MTSTFGSLNKAKRKRTQQLLSSSRFVRDRLEIRRAGSHLGVVSKSLTEAERAVIRDAVRIMRSSNAELATDLAAIVDEYARDLPAVD